MIVDPDYESMSIRKLNCIIGISENNLNRIRSKIYWLQKDEKREYKILVKEMHSRYLKIKNSDSNLCPYGGDECLECGECNANEHLLQEMIKETSEASASSESQTP